jgi:hypothetical protein
MAFNDKKILQVLKGELGKVPERCEGYREELHHLLGDVLIAESGHAVVKTTIVKKIADQVNTVGMFLYKNRARTEGKEDG